MQSSQHALMLHKIEVALSPETITRLARHSGFMKRTRKITAQAFVQACCLLALSPLGSLRTWATATS